MRAGKLGIFFTFLALCTIFAITSANADLYWENENVTRGIPRQPDGTKLQKNYFTSKTARIEPGDGHVIIVDYDAMLMYNLNPREKTYSTTDLNQPIGVPSNLSGPDKERMGKMMGEMMQIKITPTNETKVIEGYKCRKYLADVAMLQGVYWVSKEVKGYDELRAMGARVAKVVEKNPMLRQMNVAAMVEKLDGFPVHTVNTVMGGTVTSTLKRVEQKPLDPQLFKVPKGYALKGAPPAGQPGGNPPKP